MANSEPLEPLVRLEALGALPEVLDAYNKIGEYPNCAIIIP
jgi:hypothetical protein